jgi:hypothetical protein
MAATLDQGLSGIFSLAVKKYSFLIITPAIAFSPPILPAG